MHVPNKEFPPIIALLSDFGTSDHYVSVVKGVIASVCPNARVLDISHEVTPQDVREASYLLWASYQYFPENTIFVSIVDPGVGSDRKILVARSSKYTFLAPDNGLLDLVRTEENIEECCEVRTKASPYVLAPVSSTFHGRDVFAPVAAYLANGVACSEFGPAHTLIDIASPFVERPDRDKGRVLHSDRFGNLVTNIRNDLFDAVDKVRIGKIVVAKKLRYYREGTKKVPGLICGSSGLIEIVIKEGNASRELGVHAGSPFTIRWR